MDDQFQASNLISDPDFRNKLYNVEIGNFDFRYVVQCLREYFNRPTEVAEKIEWNYDNGNVFRSEI